MGKMLISDKVYHDLIVMKLGNQKVTIIAYTIAIVVTMVGYRVYPPMESFYTYVQIGFIVYNTYKLADILTLMLHRSSGTGNQFMKLYYDVLIPYLVITIITITHITLNT